MSEKPPPIVLLAKRLSKQKAKPKGRSRIETQILARDALEGGVLSETFNKALDGSVEDAAALASVLRPGWACTLEPAPAKGGIAQIRARLAEPQGEDATVKPAVYEADRAHDAPALALLDATFKGYADAGAEAPSLPFTWADAGYVLVALAVLAVALTLAAAALQALYEVFIETWS